MEQKWQNLMAVREVLGVKCYIEFKQATDPYPPTQLFTIMIMRLHILTAHTGTLA